MRSPPCVSFCQHGSIALSLCVPMLDHPFHGTTIESILSAYVAQFQIFSRGRYSACTVARRSGLRLTPTTAGRERFMPVWCSMILSSKPQSHQAPKARGRSKRECPSALVAVRTETYQQSSVHRVHHGSSCPTWLRELFIPVSLEHATATVELQKSSFRVRKSQVLPLYDCFAVARNKAITGEGNLRHGCSADCFASTHTSESRDET
jgi:hypothetical protein